MKYKLYTLLVLLLLFSYMAFFGYIFYSLSLLFLGLYAVIKSKREVAFLCCVGFFGLFLSLMMGTEINVFLTISFPLLILTFWEMMDIQKLYESFLDAKKMADRKIEGIISYILLIFIATSLLYFFLSLLSFQSPLLLVIIIVFFFLFSLYHFVTGDS